MLLRTELTVAIRAPGTALATDKKSLNNRTPRYSRTSNSCSLRIKGMCCSVRFFLATCALNLVQDLVTLVDSRSNLLLATEARRVM
jgi:hypothetical protein